MSGFTIQNLVDDFVLDDRRLGELDVQLHIRPSGRESFAIVPGRICVFDSFMGGGKVFQVHVAVDVNTYSTARIAPYTNERARDRFLLLQSLFQYFDSEDPRGWTLEFVSQRMRQLRMDLEIHPVVLARRLEISALQLAAWEQGEASPGAAMYQWCRALGVFLPPKTALVRVVDVSPDLLRVLKENPDELHRLRPDEFEQFVANRLDRMGYNVSLTGPTARKDGGIDIVAVPKVPNAGSIVLAAQVKHHQKNRKTSRDAVDRLLAWKDTDIGVGMLVTNTAFTKDALWTASQTRNKHFLRLRDFNDLQRWLQDQYGAPEEWREIPDKIELAPGVVIEIPKPRLATPFDPDSL